MLIGANLIFQVVSDIEAFVFEGAVIEDNSDYRCVSNSFTYYVMFKKRCCNQILIIEPNLGNNLDPDGGSEFMTKNVKKFIESLVSEKTYID